MLLCIDIGNTNIKFGLFDGDEMCCRWRISTDRTNLADEYAVLLLNLISSAGVLPSHITGCAISSVVPLLTPVFEEVAQRYFHQEAVIIGSQTITGINVRTEYPAEVGSDLVINALAARRLYGQPLVVIGFGTATTFVGVSAEGDLVGVAIAPGIITSGDSLFRATSTLPQVALTRPDRALGRNTIQSMQAGFVFGFVGLVKELVQRMKAELGGNPKVVVTGGMAALIGPETGVIDAVEPDLTLLGLKWAYEMNQPGGQLSRRTPSGTV